MAMLIYSHIYIYVVLISIGRRPCRLNFNVVHRNKALAKIIIISLILLETSYDFIFRSYAASYTTCRILANPASSCRVPESWPQVDEFAKNEAQARQGSQHWRTRLDPVNMSRGARGHSIDEPHLTLSTWHEAPGAQHWRTPLVHDA